MQILLSHVVIFSSLHMWLPVVTADVLKDNQYVQLEVTVSAQTLKAGESGELRIAFTPAEGIHINTSPAVEFRVDSSSSFIMKGNAQQERDAVTGFLSTTVPVRQVFGVAQDTQSGPHILSGTVVYYYCSDAEGWCMKFRQRVEVPITITD
jgi:hypothetical protein